MSEDPIGFAGGINLYICVANNPINFIDPWGLSAESAESAESILGRGWDWWSDLVAPGEGGVIYALPGETWEEYYSRFRTIYPYQFAVSESLSGWGFASASITGGISIGMGSARGYTNYAASKAFQSQALSRSFVIIKGSASRKILLSNINSGLSKAGVASLVIADAAFFYRLGLKTNAWISWRLTRQR